MNWRWGRVVRQNGSAPCPAYARHDSGHSLRVGAAQDMAAVGIGTEAILQAGGWKNERMVRRNIRKLGALEGGMAQFFGREAG